METGLWCKDNSEARMEQRREGDSKLRLDRRAARLARWWQAQPARLPLAVATNGMIVGAAHNVFSFVLYRESPRKAEERRERYGWWAAVRRGRGGDAAKRNRTAGGCVRSVARTPYGAGHSIPPAPRAAPRRQRAVLCTIEPQNARQSAYAGSSTMEGSVCLRNGTAGARMGADMAARRGRGGGGGGSHLHTGRGL